MSNKSSQGSLKELLKNMGNTNPNLRFLAEFIERQNSLGRAEGSSQGSLKELLNSMGNTDPNLRLLAEIIEKQNNLREAENSSGNKALTEWDILELKRAYKILVERNNILASALGACPYCWGSDVTCECQGHGSVGSRAPDRETFSVFILPVLNRFGLAMTEEQGEVDKSPQAKEEI